MSISAQRADLDGKQGKLDRAMRSPARFGYGALATFGLAIGSWAAGIPLAGAVIAPAQIMVEGNVKKVQHATGGVVAWLGARDGDAVRKGDVLLRLDDVSQRAGLAIILRQLDELNVRHARLLAERDQSLSIPVSARIDVRRSSPEFRELLESETMLFEARRLARTNMRAQLEKRLLQLASEIDGHRRQLAAKQRESQMIQRELRGVRELFAKNLVQITRLSQLEREAASLDGTQGSLDAQIAQAEGKIAETQLQILQLDRDLQSEVLRDIREVEPRLAELEERRVTAADQLAKSDVRAPVDGRIHQLAAHTIGGVVTPAEPAMLIVPQSEVLLVEAKITPADIDQVHAGQNARLKLHAFNTRTTPELTATIQHVAADATRDAQTGLTYFVIRASIQPVEMGKLPVGGLLPGMTGDLFVETGSRTLFQYLARPVADQFSRAFRER
jgi:HlyD family secretion protein